ncbi:SDR family NAD(P)-dependent oxidoreductase [Streptomyces sp. NBC_01317]|uniref:SDR family NAD(P)-dependent oxidoreductase n=1 Tax=Streptomyces sp. NBC_01317 TaxID=2903822 RepID=UPI002E0F6BF0|nr:SDR family NAD(P)-dependent oxidoreductase [Streptomyces sp. NBC_01317]
MNTKTWLITGSSQGLGRAVAEEVLAAGQNVVATARNPDVLRDLADKYGDQVLLQRLDVTDFGQAEEAVRAAVDTFGRLDVVVNNAGYADMIPFEDITLDNFRAQVETVFFGTVHVSKAAVPVFRKQGSGHFIQVASIGGRGTAPGVSAYQSAKFAMEGFSGVLNDELGPLGIKVTLAEPGLMRTNWSGPSMKIAPYGEAYAPTVGAIADHLRGLRGKEPVDPAKIGRVFLQVAEMDEPPLHLVLGKAAVDMNAANMAALVAGDQRWAELGRSVDFD